MSHFNDVELENQNLCQTTMMNSSALANLPREGVVLRKRSSADGRVRNYITSAIATTTTLAISALSCLSISGLSQPALAEECARFFKDRDLRGDSFSLCHTTSKTIPASFNDQISSLKMPIGRRCTLYTDAGFQGSEIEYIETGTVNLQPEFDNKVSSIQCTAAIKGK